MAIIAAKLFEETGKDLYAKDEDQLLFTWTSNVINFTETGVPGLYTASLDDTKTYHVFERLGANPANSDLKVGTFTSSNVNIVQANGVPITLFDESDLIDTDGLIKPVVTVSNVAFDRAVSNSRDLVRYSSTQWRIAIEELGAINSSNSVNSRPSDWAANRAN